MKKEPHDVRHRWRGESIHHDPISDIPDMEKVRIAAELLLPGTVQGTTDRVPYSQTPPLVSSRIAGELESTRS